MGFLRHTVGALDQLPVGWRVIIRELSEEFVQAERGGGLHEIYYNRPGNSYGNCKQHHSSARIQGRSRIKCLNCLFEKLGAVETARLLGVDPHLVYKTIVVTRPKGKPILAVIPGPNRVDLKLLANHLGEKKVSLPTEHEAESLTGLQAGGISPLALLNKGFQIVIDISAKTRLEIHLSGGQRGMNIKLPVQALGELTNARFAEISIPDIGNAN